MRFGEDRGRKSGQPALLEAFGPGRVRWIPELLSPRALEPFLVPRRVRGRGALLRLIPAPSHLFLSASTLHHFTNVRPIVRPSLLPSSRNVIYLFTRRGVTRFWWGRGDAGGQDFEWVTGEVRTLLRRGCRNVS